MSILNLPTELDLKNVTKLSQAITGAELNNIIASNGYEYTIPIGGVGSYVNFVLPSNEKLNIDLNSVYITGELQLPRIATIVGHATTTSSTYFTLCDNIESMIDMIQVSINGNIIEEIRNYNLIESSLINWHVNDNYVHAVQPSSLQGGNWRMKHKILTNRTDGIADGVTNFDFQPIKFAFPIRLSGVFSGTNKLFPTYLADGNMQLRIYLKGCESVVKSIRISSAGAQILADNNNVPTYSVKNMKLHYKSVTVSDSYYSELMSYIGSDKYTIPIDTFYSELKNISVIPGAFSWSESINCNLSNVNAVFLAFFRTSELGTQQAYGEDRVRYPNLSTCRIQVNGKSIPVGPAIDFTSEEGRYHLLRALNSMRSAETIGNFSMPQIALPIANLAGINTVSLGYFYNKEIDVNSFSFGYTGGPPATTPPSLFTFGNTLFDKVSCFVAGFDCRKSDYETDQLSGLDLSSNGQITIQATFNSPAAVNYTCCIFVHHTKVLSIGGGNVEIMD